MIFMALLGVLIIGGEIRFQYLKWRADRANTNV